MTTETHGGDLFDEADRHAVVQRLRALSAGDAARWGRMDVAQMVAHCQAPLNVALGRLPLRRNLLGVLFGRLAKRSLVSAKPFGRDLPTHPSFRVRDARDFERERARLVELVEAFGEGPAVLTAEPHPLFGRLTPAEWSRMQWKHLDHHLRQFGH